MLKIKHELVVMQLLCSTFSPMQRDIHSNSHPVSSLNRPKDCYEFDKA